MKSVLIATNIASGFINDNYAFACIDAAEVCRNIVEASNRTTATFIVNDCHHAEDKELTYLPPHMITNTLEHSRLYYVEKQLNNFYFLEKNTLSAVHKTHNKQTIMNLSPNIIYLAGFCICLDILATALDLVQSGRNICIVEDAVSDVDENHKSTGVSLLKWMGIPFIESSKISC